MAVLLATFLATDVPAATPLVYPQAVSIDRFVTEKVIYIPGEDVRFLCDFTSPGNRMNDGSGSIEIQVWIERGVAQPQLRASKTVQRRDGGNKEHLVWKAGDGLFGHLATVKLVDAFGRVLAEGETIFDVADNWVDVMRLASLGANHAATEAMTDDRIQAAIARMRKGFFNAFEVFTFSPKPYVLAPTMAEWPYPYRSSQIIRKDRLLAWSRLLHQSGIKYVAYNETSAIEGPPDWHVYLDGVSGDKPVAPYFADRGMFSPNSLKVAPLFADQLAESVRMFGWDGILMDSALANHVSTSKGRSQDGEKLTELSPGEVGSIYLRDARRKVRAAKPDFAFLAQNATNISSGGVRLDTGEMYSWIRKNAEKLQVGTYSEFVDLYTLEIDPHNEPRDGRYPLTYEKMSVALNSVVESTGRPLMSWATVASPYKDEYSVAFSRPYMALILASRTKLHDHFDFFGGALSDGADSPVSRHFIKYNRFVARYSYYLWNPKFKWDMDPSRILNIQGSKSLFWNKTVYTVDLGNGSEITVVNLLNLPPNGLILGQSETPEPFQNGVLTLSPGVKAERVTYVSADDDSLKHLDLHPAARDGGATKFNIPPVMSWSLLIIQRRKG